MKAIDSISEAVTGIVFIAQEMSEDNGEDYAEIAGYQNGYSFAVFDGCGGMGSQTYSCFSGKTGAFVASRMASQGYFEWYQGFVKAQRRLDAESFPRVCNEIHDVLEKSLIKCKILADKSENVQLLKGSIQRPFPTTASIVLCDRFEELLTMYFIWAGDSRGYVLNDSGIMQISIDDIGMNHDALANLHNDAPLRNVLSADGDFVLNGCYLEMQLPGLVITATDGCFGYLPTPMHFEYFILLTLVSSTDFAEWERNLNAQFAEFAADDFSIIICAFGFEDFAHLQNYFFERARYLYINYIGILKDESLQDAEFDAAVQQMWNTYREGYYRDTP